MFGHILVLFDHASHEGNLSRDIKVVRAILGARFEGLIDCELCASSQEHDETYVLAVQAIGANGGDQNEGLLGQCTQVVPIQVTNLDSYGQC